MRSGIRSTKGAARPRHDSGFALIELIVSGVVLVGIAGGALTAIQAADRTGSEERHRAQAFGIAQEDQARLRSFQISELSNYHASRSVTADGTPYTVASDSEFVTDTTGTASCEQDTASPDYIRISSTVTWPSMGARPPAVLQSIVAPPNGSIAADRGALAIAVQGGQGQGVAGVGLSVRPAGSGTQPILGSTGVNGCVIFGNLPEGNYTVTPSASSLVDRDSEPPTSQDVGVVALSTNTVVLQYDHPGSVEVDFRTRVGTGLVPSTADSVVVFNTGMTLEKAFGEIDARATSVIAAPLFPFASPNSIYAGTCAANNPNPTDEVGAPGAPAMATVIVPPGGSATTTIQLPALHLNVLSGQDPSNPGAPVPDARVRVRDQSCGTERTLSTNAAGELPDPGLPWGVYEVCADDGAQSATVSDVGVQDLDAGTRLELYLASGAPGTCP